MKVLRRKYNYLFYRDWVQPPGIKSICKASLLLLCLFISSSFRQDKENSEYKLKAVFIYNFTLYIEWDPSMKSDDFTIGVLGNSSIDGPLEEIARTKTCNGRKITIHHYNSPDELSQFFCQILFIPRNTNATLDAVLSKTPKGTLTVSEKPGSAERGTAINFVIVDNKLRFESNPKAINSAGLKASSQLLKLAIIVE
jgi:hypothetical protein